MVAITLAPDAIARLRELARAADVNVSRLVESWIWRESPTRFEDVTGREGGPVARQRNWLAELAAQGGQEEEDK